MASLRTAHRSWRKHSVMPQDLAYERGLVTHPHDTCWTALRSWAHALVEEASARYRELATADGEAGRRRERQIA